MSAKNILTGLIKQIIHKKKPIAELDRQIFHHAFQIAVKTLRNRYTENGIHAGKTHFSDIWLRDSCFASFGSLALGDYEIVRQNLKTILNNSNPQGQVPLRVGQKHLLLKFIGIKGNPRPRYIEDKGYSIPSDGNSLFIITLKKYIEKTKDLRFLKENFKQIKKIIDWNFSLDEDKDLLLEEGPYAGWADSLKKQGKVFYTNVLHFHAISCFAYLCSKSNKQKLYEKYTSKKDKIKSKINKTFWNGSFFIDWAHKHRHTYFSTDGNILAIVFELANKNQAKKIQNCIHEFDLDHGFSTQTNYPKYHNRHVYWPFFPLKLEDYHNGLVWLWIGCVDVVAKKIAGNNKAAYALLLKIAKKIIESKGIYEVYHNNKPVNRFFYRSEQGFAWSSGLFIWACKELNVV
ncbi:amylo-alpha-1,6-glucosidase [Candidatus Margulisiibacteriota bacterium]